MEPDNTINTRKHDETTTNWSHLAPMVALGVGLIAVTIFALNEKSQIDTLSQQADSHQQEIATLQSRMAAADSTFSGTVGKLQDQLTDEEAKTSKSIASVQSAAVRHADQVAQTLKTNIDKQSEQQEALNAQIADVKTATTQASAKIDGAMSRIDGVGADVDSVRTDLVSTKSMANNTQSDLQRARGDMGVMSGLIATNSNEIGQLRALGDRNIYEFTIDKKSGLQKVGDVQIRLNKADPKKSLYTMVVFANDRMIEKKDKTSNEPVQFYVGSGSRTPYEVVVNDVTKDTIKGYLATPKVTTASK
jgi:hypothetical protein